VLCLKSAFLPTYSCVSASLLQFSYSVTFYLKNPLNVQQNISLHRKSVIYQYSVKRQKGIETARNKQGKRQSVIFYHRHNLDCIIHVLLNLKKVSRKLNTRSAAEKTEMKRQSFLRNRPTLIHHHSYCSWQWRGDYCDSSILIIAIFICLQRISCRRLRRCGDRQTVRTLCTRLLTILKFEYWPSRGSGLVPLAAP